MAAERGLDIKVVEFTDYVIPNQALALGDLEANSFQHEPYLKNQISKTGWKIVKVATTIASPQGVYSLKYKKLKYKKLADLPSPITLLHHDLMIATSFDRTTHRYTAASIFGPSRPHARAPQ